jgi:hypothetical protein
MHGFRLGAFFFAAGAFAGCGGESIDHADGAGGSPAVGGGGMSAGAAGAWAGSGGAAGSGGSAAGGGGAAGSGGNGAASADANVDAPVLGDATDATLDHGVLVDAPADRIGQDANAFCSGQAPKLARDDVPVDFAGFVAVSLPLGCCEGAGFTYLATSDASPEIRVTIMAQYGQWPIGTFTADEPLDGSTEMLVALVEAGLAGSDKAQGTITIQRSDAKTGVSMGFCLAVPNGTSTGRGITAYSPVVPISY